LFMKLRATLLSMGAVVGMLDAAAGRAQSLPAGPAFEVVAIKPNHGCGGPGRGSGGKPSPGRMTLECADLRDLIVTAYGIYGDDSGTNARGFRMQVLGGPGWVDSERYDIVAKAEGNPSREQIYGPMLRGLLEERFQLKVHREARAAPVYFLTAAKGGTKLHAAREGSCVSSGEKPAHVCGSAEISGSGVFDMYGATLANFATQLGIRLDREVIDKTGIAGTFDIHLEVNVADLAPRFVAGGEIRQTDSATSAGADDSNGPSIFTALQQQLGLKLESARGTQDVLVIDRIEKPGLN
jgi:uncharacterized protein (TIGR03435 family)